MQFSVLLFTVVAKFILLCIVVTTHARRHGGIGVAGGGAQAPSSPIVMRTMTKMRQKSLLFRQLQFLLAFFAYNSTRIQQ